MWLITAIVKLLLSAGGIKVLYINNSVSINHSALPHNNGESAIVAQLKAWLALTLCQNSPVVALVDGQPITATALLNDVALLIHTLTSTSEFNTAKTERWVIWQDCSYRFLVAFLALLLTGKKILLPQNLQQGTAIMLAAEIDGIIAQMPIAELPCQRLAVAVATPLNTVAANKSAINVNDHHVLLRQCLVANDWREANLTLFTSGSTGESKKITKAIFQLEAECALLEKTWPQQNADAIIYSTVSHQHIYGLLFRVLWPLLSARCFVAHTFQYPEPLAAQMALLAKPAVLIASPAHLSRMPELISLASLSPWLTQVFSSGGPLARATALTFNAALHVAPIEVLGSTETGGVAWRQQNENSSENTVPWQLLANVSTRINAEGALDIQSLHAGEGWQTLGDNVEFVDERHFYLKGRSDRIVKIEEKRLSLTELENHLLATPWLSEVKAVILQGARTRVGVVAILNGAGRVQLNHLGRRFFNEALREHLLQHFERVLLPRHWRYVEQWPINAQGKVPQAALISLFNDGAM